MNLFRTKDQEVQHSPTLRGPTWIHYPMPNSKPTRLVLRPIPDLG